MKDDIDSRLDRALAARWSDQRTVLRRTLKERTPHIPTARGASPRGERPLTPEQYAVLRILDGAGPGLTVREISRRCDFPHANATRTLDRLEKRGLLIRLRDKIDRRRVVVRLTVEGKKLGRELDAVEETVYHILWGMYTPEEKAALLRLLTGKPGVGAAAVEGDGKRRA